MSVAKFNLVIDNVIFFYRNLYSMECFEAIKYVLQLHSDTVQNALKKYSRSASFRKISDEREDYIILKGLFQKRFNNYGEFKLIMGHKRDTLFRKSTERRNFSNTGSIISGMRSLI